jgi:phosphoribosyl-ATP pyrophosphohydrolase/phosphoribosyl-AMP cyclohydrolase
LIDNALDDRRLDWTKGDGLLPAIVQHWRSGEVLMLGYMNREALAQTRAGGKLTFYSRTRQCLWTKGETSGNALLLKTIRTDCDADTLLIEAEPQGPTCHNGTSSCFGDSADVRPSLGFLAQLDTLVARRREQRLAGSYTGKLFDRGVCRIAQKVGEEAVETALAAVAEKDTELLDEAADLLFHLTVLLRARNLSLADAAAVLARRNAENERTVSADGGCG